ncbi:OmpA/MotB domain protein (modular protein) [Candidatus Zixiibacteriota bacterium]|nr:OmpA/MotB domain protein (modular protein) [candidate division Zixibacteria bacterium]
MKRLTLIFIVAILILSAIASAQEMKGRTVIGIRAPFLLPFWAGNDFSYYGANYQPFLRGWDVAAEVKRGFSDHIMLGLTAGYTTTYDDTLKKDNRGDVASKKDNASAKLTGILIGLNAEYYYDKQLIFQPYLLGGLAVDLWKVKSLANDKSYNSTDLGIKIGTGLLIPIKDNFSIDVQGKVTFEKANLSTSVPEGFYGPGDWSKYSKRPFHGYFEPSIGLLYAFGGSKDSDKDGVSDAKDDCPNTLLGAKVDKRGCPTDSDGDGVYDGIDKCPDTPKGAKVDAQGCPIDSDKDGVFDGIDKCPDTPTGVKVDQFGCPLDADGDGVPDYLDKCPDTPKGAKVDAQGCPMDSDKDGVYDGLDKCPDTPAGVQVDKNGCPYDSDYDGVPDSLDQCPGTPRGIKVDAKGCPFVKKMEVSEKIVLHINYASNSAEPDAASKKQLDSIALRIMAYSDTKVEIRGFTDDRNTEAYNLALSQKRAEGVMAYLKSKGVQDNQMTAKGYGEDPKYFIADNKTAEGRRQNRRVEIESVK